MLEALIEEIGRMSLRRTPARPFRAQHITVESITLYVRVGPRLCAGKVLDAVTLADATVKPESRSNGLFGLFLTGLEAVAPTMGLECVVCESVINARLAGHLRARGYVETMPGQPEWGPTLFKALAGANDGPGAVQR